MTLELLFFGVMIVGVAVAGKKGSDKMSYLITHLRFIYETRIYPRKAKHYWCKFYNWTTKTTAIGWYVRDKKGKMIPWVHFKDDPATIMCLYESMITPINYYVEEE